MNNIEYRYAQNIDIKALQKLFGKFYLCYRDALIKTIQKKRIIVAIDTVNDKKVIGLLNISAKYDKILMLIINDDYRRQGIAMKLFKIAQILYKLKKIHILAVKASIPFWKRCGFQETGVIQKTKTGEIIQMVSG